MIKKTQKYPHFVSWDKFGSGFLLTLIFYLI